jgi:predicted GIY-YIG superfamily endonuclease
VIEQGALAGLVVEQGALAGLVVEQGALAGLVVEQGALAGLVVEHGALAPDVETTSGWVVSTRSRALAARLPEVRRTRRGHGGCMVVEQGALAPDVETTDPQPQIRGLSGSRSQGNPSQMAWTYILRCADGSYYVGSTTNLEARLHQHRTGLGSVYTKHRLPVLLVWAHEFERVSEAFGFEKQVQNWSRAKREALIEGRLVDLPDLAWGFGCRRRGAAE